MPDWLGGAIVGAILALFARIFESHQRRDQFRNEQLMARYCELAATVARDVDRARELAAGVVLCTPNAEFFAQSESLRAELRRDFLRLVFQIALLEPNNDLVVRIQTLATQQPFLAFPGPYQPNPVFTERFNQFEHDLQAFRTAVWNLFRDIAQQHRSWPFQLPDATW